MFTHTTKIARSVAFVGDMHVGSPWGLWPLSVNTPHGGSILASPGQYRLENNWHDFCKYCKLMHVDTVILGGDLMDGIGKKANPPGSDKMTVDPSIQLKAAKQLLDPLCRNRQVLGVESTDYHKNGLEQELVEHYGEWCGMLLNMRLKETGHVLNIAHGAGGGGVVYRSTKMDRELLFMLASEAAGKLDHHTDLMIRFHSHFAGYLDSDGANAFLQVPAWVTWTPYNFGVKNYGRWQPTIGAYVVLFAQDKHILPFGKSYPLPRIADFVRER